MMEQFKVVKGKLVNQQGIITKLEFGNLDQIKAIREYEKHLTELKNGGKLVEPSYEITVEATIIEKCVCGCNIHYSQTSYNEHDHGDVFIFNSVKNTCKCGNVYQFKVDDEGDLRMFLIN